jgi:hypothetical protein
MSGGIVQLVATGAQDTWLTGKPEVSFFRSSYKRYTHYANSVERQLIQGNPSAGNISTIRLEKKGDLFNYVYFIAKDSTGALIPGIDWSKVVDKVELLIGGQIVDTQDNTWMTQIEPVVGAQNYSQRYLNNDTDGLTNVINGFMPLKFFFCKDWNVSLPLVALQYHDIEIRITWSANLNYRVGYELYSVAVPTVSSFAGSATATTSTTVATGTTISANLTTILAIPGGATSGIVLSFTGATGTIFAGQTLGAIIGATSFTVTAVSQAQGATAGTVTGTFAGGTVLAQAAGVSLGSFPFSQPGSTAFTSINITVTPTAGAITPGQIVAGFNPTAATNFPVVAAVFGTIITLTVTSATATNLDTLLSSKTLQFFPAGTFGVISGAATPGGGAAAGSTITLGTSSNPTVTIANGALVGYSVIVVNGTNAQSTYLVGNAYVQTNTGGTAITISYNTGLSQPSAVVPTSSQVLFVKQVSAISTLAGNQPYVDREGTAIINIGTVYGSAPVVGQNVLGTQYTGPVTVSSVISSSVFEVSFPVQTQTVNTTTGTGTLLQFIDPSQSVAPPGVTASTTGFSGTYAQLQYEAWTNFVYLDQSEREYFANTPMDILFTQVNRIPIGTNNMQELALAHPVKYLAFLANNYTTAYQNAPTTGIPAANYQFKTQINGVDIGDSRSMFQWMDVPHYYHTPFGYKHSGATAPVALISYCLDTSKLQPTGTLNFSRIDTYRIVAPAGVSLSTLSGAAGNYFYAVNYNVLRIKDGMGGMLYSN